MKLSCTKSAVGYWTERRLFFAAADCKTFKFTKGFLSCLEVNVYISADRFSPLGKKKVSWEIPAVNITVCQRVHGSYKIHRVCQKSCGISIVVIDIYEGAGRATELILSRYGEY